LLQLSDVLRLQFGLVSLLRQNGILIEFVAHIRSDAPPCTRRRTGEGSFM
jgi:hypothetical protein